MNTHALPEEKEKRKTVCCTVNNQLKFSHIFHFFSFSRKAINFSNLLKHSKVFIWAQKLGAMSSVSPLLPAQYEVYLPSSGNVYTTNTYTNTDTTTPNRLTSSHPKPLHQDLIQQTYNASSSDFNTSNYRSPNAALHRSPRVARSPSPSSTPNSRTALEGVSVKNKPYDFITPAHEGGDGLQSLPMTATNGDVFLPILNATGTESHLSQPTTSQSESPTRRSLSRAKEASEMDPETLALRDVQRSFQSLSNLNSKSSRQNSFSVQSGVSVKNQHYDFVSPHDMQHIMDRNGTLHHKPTNVGTSPTKGSEYSSNHSVHNLRSLVQDAAGGSVERSPNARRSGSPQKRGTGDITTTTSDKGSGVSVLNEPYDFVGPVESTAGGIISHGALTRSPTSSQANTFKGDASGIAPVALNGKAFSNERHDYAEAAEEGYNSLTGDPMLSATLPPYGNSQGKQERLATRSPDAVPSTTDPYHRAGSSSMTRMVANIMSGQAHINESSDLHAYAAEALAIAQQQQFESRQGAKNAITTDQSDRYRAVPSIGHSTQTQRTSASSSTLVTPPPQRHRSPSQRPHVDICQVVSTVPLDASEKTRGVGYISPRRQIVSASSQQAQTLLDTARTTVAMLTEELVGLRREHAQLQKAYAEQSNIAAAGRKVSSHVEHLHRQLDAKDKELAAERAGRLKIEAEFAKLAERADIVADANEKLKKERTMLISKLQAAEQEVLSVKVTAKSAIDQMAAALASMSEQ